MIALWIFLLLIGFVLLVKGADFFVDGASGIAKKLKVSTFIIGLTVVALGTSFPEAAVSVIGGIKTALGENGGAEVIMGNVLGSNMMNILLILGITSLIAKVPVGKSSRFIELPFLIIISLIFILLGDIGGGYAWYDGLILLVLYAGFLAYTIVMAKRAKPQMLESAAVAVAAGSEEVASAPRQGLGGFIDRVSAGYKEQLNKTWFLVLITIGGIAMIVGGAQCVVTGATEIATALGVPANIIALTVVAFGTSLPELVTSVSAARKGDMGLATGNIIGSNIANLLFVAGLGFVSCGASGVPFDLSSLSDGYVSIIAAVLLLVFSLFKGNKLGKAAGVTFLVVLAAYYAYRVCAACGVCPPLNIPAIFTKF